MKPFEFAQNLQFCIYIIHVYIYVDNIIYVL